MGAGRIEQRGSLHRLRADENADEGHRDITRGEAIEAIEAPRSRHF